MTAFRSSLCRARLGIAVAVGLGLLLGSGVTSSQDTKTFAVVVPHPGSPYFDTIAQAYRAKVIEAGANPIEMRPGSNVETLANLEALRARHVDGVALWVSEPGLTSAVQELVDADIPLVTLGTDLPNSGRIAFVATDQQALGEALGEVAGQLEPNGGTYAIVGGSGDPVASLRIEGAKAKLGESWVAADPNSSLTDNGNSIGLVISVVPAENLTPEVRQQLAALPAENVRRQVA